MYIFPCAIVTVALSHLAGSSAPAPRPCMHGQHGGLGASGDRAGLVRSVGRSHRSRGVQISAQLSGWSLR
jgi:hypothetical protein